MEDALKDVEKASAAVLAATAAKNEPARQSALQELRDAVEKAVDAIEDFENDSRAPVVSLVMKAMKDNDKLSASAKKKDKDAIDDDSLDLAESVCGVINSLRDEAARCPDPARKKALEKTADDLDNALAEVLKVSRAVRDGTATPEEQAKAAAKLKAALGAADRLVNPQSREKDHPSLSRFVCTARTDPDQQSLDQAGHAVRCCLAHCDITPKKLEENPDEYRKECERVADELNKIADSIKLTPEKKVAYEAEKLSKDLAALTNAMADGDEDAIEEFLLECNEDKQNLVDGIRSVASMCKSDDPADQALVQSLNDDLGNIEKLTSQMAQIARASPDECNVMEAVKCAESARVVLKNLEDSTCPEADMKLALADKAVKEDLEELRRAIAKDDSEAARKAAKKLDKDAEELAHTADLIARRDAVLDPEKAKRVMELARSIDGTAEDMRQAAKTWDKSRKAGDKAGAAEAKARCSKKADSMEKDVNDLRKLLDEPYREALTKENQTLNKLANAASVKHDPKETVAAMHDLIDQHKKLGSVPKPVNADRARQDAAHKRFNDLLPKAAAASKACLQTPSAEADKAMRDVVYDMQNELLEMKAAGDKGSEKGRAEDVVVAARKNLADVIRAAAAGDEKAKEQAKNSLKSNIDQLEEILNDPNGLFSDGKCADRAEIEDAIETLKKQARDIDKNAEQMKVPLDVISRNLEAPRDEACDAKKRIRALAVKARKGATNLNRRNLDDLVKAGKNLASALNTFGDTARFAAAAGPGTKKSNAALALDDLLRQMELGGPMADAAELERLMDEACGDEPAAPAGEKSFAAEVAQVATDIKAAVEEHKKEILSIPGLDASPISVFLQKLADAAHNNQRQEMLVSARGVSACIMSFCKELTSCAKRCKDPIFQDKMYSSVAALKNFGTQVKILTSVKAASEIDESDSDEQIVSVIKSLGKTTTDALDSIEIANKANLLR